jgi:hypothetical protein
MLAPTDEAQVIAEARAAFARLKRHTTWSDWCAIGRALVLGRDRAMRISGVNRPYGRGYTSTFGAWLRLHAFDELHNSVRGVLMRVVDRLPDIERWRDSLDEAARLRLNHPDSIWRGYCASTHGAAQRRIVRPRTICTPAAPSPSTSPATGQKPKAPGCTRVTWPQDAIERAVDAVAKSWNSRDTMVIALAVLNSSIRNRADFDELLAAQAQPPKPAKAAKPRTWRRGRPAQADLVASAHAHA